MAESKKNTQDEESKDKIKAIESTIQSIEKQFGKGSIMRLDNEASIQNVVAISSGSICIDSALGVGGFPRGRIIEIYGPEASGKTTLALHAIAETQANGGVTAFVDAEHAFDPSYARGIGIKTGELLISQPDYGEQALEIVDQLVRSSAVDMVVVDSVAALTPKTELDGDMGDTHVGLQARLMSQALRKITATVSRSKCTVIFINQLRMKIGVPSYMSPETTTGGNALKFYSSVRLDVRRIASITTSDSVVGNRCRVKVVKNKVAPKFKSSTTQESVIANQTQKKETQFVDPLQKIKELNEAKETDVANINQDSSNLSVKEGIYVDSEALLLSVTSTREELRAFYQKYKVDRAEVLTTIKNELKKSNLKIDPNTILAEVEKDVNEESFQNNFYQFIKKRVSGVATAIANRNN